MVANPYRRFGTTYRSRSPKILLGLLDPWRWDRWVVTKRRYETTILGCINPKRAVGLLYRLRWDR